jgi:uncharacterized BrkB/YihY/UPF0761 family membrane protein
MGEWPATLVLGEILVEFAFIALGWLVVCHFLPHDPDANRWIHQLPGALLVGFGVLGMRTAMVYYFAPRAVTLSDRYGDVAAGLLIITWAYWIAFMVVFAAELNAASFRSRQARLGG